MENLAMTVTPINPMRIRRAREKVREALAELTAALEEAEAKAKNAAIGYSIRSTEENEANKRNVGANPQ